LSGHLEYVVKKGIEKHIDNTPGKINMTELQKIALLGSLVTSSEKVSCMIE